jgi:membrane protease YdiL (CAAX protease family)
MDFPGGVCSRHSYVLYFIPLPYPKTNTCDRNMVIFTSVVNGLIEEFYWRGLYFLEYRDNKWIGFFLSTLLFGAWHFAVWFAKGVHYNGGILPLVGGAYFLGLLWAWVTRSTGNFRAAAFAHSLINLFALTGLFVANGF